jgi:nucleotide-binding universal stress UspA family protein
MEGEPIVRILLAVDGSEPADRAAALIASTPRGKEDAVWIVAVAPTRGDVFGSTWGAPLPSDPEGVDAAVVATYVAAADRAASEVRDARAEIAIETVVLRGRPASVIVDRARDLGVDLIVVGHRGRGAWTSRLLGSVSAEVVDHAPCPVLVARDDQLGPVVLAVDGSAHARAATHVVADWPMLRGLPVHVIGVTENGFPYASAVAPLVYEETVSANATAVAAEQRIREADCDAALEQLGAAGVAATAELRSGDPAHEIIAAAEVFHAGLVVVGTRGLTGLRRLILGSVARNVLLSAPCSVLVVRDGAGNATTRTAREHEVVSAFG